MTTNMNWFYVVKKLQEEAEERYTDVYSGKCSVNEANIKLIAAEVIFALSKALRLGTET